MSIIWCTDLKKIPRDLPVLFKPINNGVPFMGRLDTNDVSIDVILGSEQRGYGHFVTLNEIDGFCEVWSKEPHLEIHRGMTLEQSFNRKGPTNLGGWVSAPLMRDGDGNIVYPEPPSNS